MNPGCSPPAWNRVPALHAWRMRWSASAPYVGRWLYDVVVMTLLPDSSSATMSSVLVFSGNALLAAWRTTSASSARIAALSLVAVTPVGGRPTSVPASTPTLAGS